VKNFVITLALAAVLGAPAALAQTPAPPPNGPPPAGAPAANSKVDHQKIEAALKQLNLTPRQKIQMARIMKTAKENNQDKKVTMKQIAQVLTPDQQAKLKKMLEQKAAQPK
jgi:Spy/CpxP family protein refolding chaperone